MIRKNYPQFRSTRWRISTGRMFLGDFQAIQFFSSDINQTKAAGGYFSFVCKREQNGLETSAMTRLVFRVYFNFPDARIDFHFSTEEKKDILIQFTIKNFFLLTMWKIRARRLEMRAPHAEWLSMLPIIKSSIWLENLSELTIQTSTETFSALQRQIPRTQFTRKTSKDRNSSCNANNFQSKYLR